MANRYLDLGLFITLCGFFIGCGAEDSPPAETGPSYSETVVTYNAELETLDRLEAKREKLIAAFAAASLASSNASVTTLPQLEGLLESAKGIKDGNSSELPTDPNELLDSLSERNADASEIAEQLLGGLLGGSGQDESPAAPRELTPEEKAAAAERKATFDDELASLDQELGKQKQRVDRARDARDAAESR